MGFWGGPRGLGWLSVNLRSGMRLRRWARLRSWARLGSRMGGCGHRPSLGCGTGWLCRRRPSLGRGPRFRSCRPCLGRGPRLRCGSRTSL
jgi:hypothetical protein